MSGKSSLGPRAHSLLGPGKATCELYLVRKVPVVTSLTIVAIPLAPVEVSISFAVVIVICSNVVLNSVLPEAGLTMSIFDEHKRMAGIGTSASIHIVCARAPIARIVPIKIVVHLIFVYCGIKAGVCAPV